MSKRLRYRPDPDVRYVTVYDRYGTEQYVSVEDVYLPGDNPRGQHMTQEDQFARLRQLRDQAVEQDAELRRLMNVEVLRLREGRRSWTEIGAALGISRQAAWERWGKRRQVSDA